MGDPGAAATAAGVVQASEGLAVHQVCADYVDSRYVGDVDRMEWAVHPELAKPFIRGFPSGTAAPPDRRLD